MPYQWLTARASGHGRGRPRPLPRCTQHPRGPAQESCSRPKPVAPGLRSSDIPSARSGPVASCCPPSPVARSPTAAGPSRQRCGRSAHFFRNSRPLFTTVCSGADTALCGCPAGPAAAPIPHRRHSGQQLPDAPPQGPVEGHSSDGLEGSGRRTSAAEADLTGTGVQCAIFNAQKCAIFDAH